MTVYLSNTASRYLARLNEPYKGQILSALEDLSNEPPEGDIKPLTGQKGSFRLRIGEYRAIFRFKDDYILVSHIAPRGQAYTKKTRS